MKRVFDLLLSMIVIFFLGLPMLVIALLVRLTSQGPSLHWSKRIGLNNQFFLMPKFRSMKINTPQLATHLMTNSQSFLTPIGSFIRKTSLDELPQIISVIKGDMSFVGPRPALFNQDDLIKLRAEKNVHTLKPGITGWAQINGRDELPIPIKVEFDQYYLKNKSLILDLKIIFLTAYKVFKSDGISH
jgi:O-antigen biosynthesis protein WbqP